MNVNIPKRRFKGFSEDWEQEKFSNIFKRVSESSDSEAIPIVEYEDIDNESRVLKSDFKYRFSSRDGLKFSEKDILFGKLRPYLRNQILSDFKGKAIGDFWILRSQMNHPIFDYYLLDTPRLSHITNLTTGTRMPRSDWNTIDSYNIKVPVEIKETERIAHFLSLLDKAISLHKRKFEKLKQLQKSYLSESVFSETKCVPKRRFKGFTEPWEQRKLKDITEKISERNTDNHYQNVFTNSALHGIINQTDYFDRNIANSTNLTNYYVVQKDNFIYNPRISSNAPYGPINRNKLNQVGVMSPLYLVFENRLASHDFLEYYFFSSKWYRYMLKVGNTGARSDRYAIKNKDFFNMPIFIPEYNEQCKVGNILKVLNKTITLHKHKHNAIKILQKIYLQNNLEDETYA